MGKCVDKYCLNEELKHMEHCQIYIGQERTTKQEVFVKVFSLKFIEKNKTLHQKVLNEMTIIESNDFPFIVKAVSYLKTANNMYHVYDYFPEKSLRELIAENGGFSVDDACRKARRILECTLALHSNNIIHRNLKPSALLVKNKDLFLTNFLNAIQLENPEMQNDEVYGGSLIYRAPEALFSPQFTKKSDVFSIGVILYEMIFGVPPHSEGQILASNGSFPNLEFKGHLRGIKLPPAVDELIRRLMSKNPMQRFSASEAITFLDSKILNNSPVPIEAPPAVTETPEKYLINLFKRFQRKISFLNELGDQLNDEFLEIDCGVYLAYVVLKKLYLLTKSFKQFVSFDSLKEMTPMAQKIIWSKEYPEVEDFVIRIEREALSQLVTYQNVLLKNFNSRTHKELAKDLETLDDFKIWDVVVKTVIEPFFEQVRNFAPDSRVLPKVALFMKNVEENVLLNCQSELILL